ncbi:trypsin alpha-3-like [Sitophilus oryzae]|uniref:Trypsin alpha-3-like n=1 Tax=Sitophilus oryzae TaxID=7048 RepID=A0A6J2XFK3_SITOR|nr:trypsin alpha-3-like [Sitophilus oryzae]
MKVLLVLAAVVVAALADGYIQPELYPTIPREYSNSSDLKIVAGSNAVRNQFPYQISLRVVSGTSLFHICGGSILSQRWVLSAAHCTQRAANQFRVTAGILLQTDTGIANQQTVAVSYYVNHASYPGGNVVAANDISVIRLASLLTYGVNVQPIALPVAGAVPSGTAVVSGWGSLGPPTNSAPNNLQFVNVPILAKAQCANVIAQLSGIINPFRSALNVCTTTRSASSIEAVCSGDSGGPLVVNSRVVGVVSWGYSPCGNAGFPSVYVDTAAYIAWIQQNTNNLSNN